MPAKDLHVVRLTYLVSVQGTIVIGHEHGEYHWMNRDRSARVATWIRIFGVFEQKI